ncbi:conserved hypothetical protein [Methylotenera mobilis JLW8]|uniref:Cytochrome C oxidase subunit IV n=2 Tax=Methylotenera mobilis TaxID=359408 RepID=C6WVL3_METML|nr:conserved hypothetical protein [Methylotenera mobilis JLW8]
MNQSNNHFSICIWLALVALTIVTYFIGEEVTAGKAIMLSVLVIALIKGQLIANYFMGLRQVSWLWRGIILGYFVVVGVMVAIAYLM